MHEWSLLLVSLCWKQQVRSGSPTQYDFASIITQTAIWHVTVTESNATGDCCRSTHYASSVGSITPQWQPSVLTVWAAYPQAANPTTPPPLPILTHPQPKPLIYSLSLLYRFCVVLHIGFWYSRVIVVTVVALLPFSSPAMTSVFPCTIPQTRPTKLALKDKTSVSR